jgi:hypothetical protein
MSIAMLYIQYIYEPLYKIIKVKLIEMPQLGGPVDQLWPMTV